jgi:hypothetical protein
MATTIQIDGDQIQINDAASEETLKELVDLLKRQSGTSSGSTATNNQQKKAADDMSKAAKGLKNASVDLGKVVETFDDIETKTNATFASVGAKISKELKTISKNTGNVISDLIRGPASFETLGRAVQAGSQQAGELMEEFAQGAAGAVPGIGAVGTAGKAVAGALGAAAMGIAAYAQNMTDGFVALSQSGANYNGDIVKTAAQINGLGLTLNSFTQIVQQNAAGLATYGGSVTNGTRAFVELAEVMRGSYGGELYALGLRYEEQAEQLAKYTSVQSRNTIFSTLSYQEQSAAFKEYITDLNELASITGKSRQQLAEEMAQNNLRADANIRLQGATEEAQKMMSMAFKMGGEGSPLSNIMMAGAAGRSLAQEIAAGTPGIREFVAANPEAAEKLRTMADQMARGEIDQKGFLAGLKALGPGIENSAQELRSLYGISDIATVTVQAASDLQQFQVQLQKIDTSAGKAETGLDHVGKKATGAGGQFILAESALRDAAGTIKQGVQDAISEGVTKMGLDDVDIGDAIQRVINQLDRVATIFKLFANDPLDFIIGGLDKGDIIDQVYDAHNKKDLANKTGLSKSEVDTALNSMDQKTLEGLVFSPTPAVVEAIKGASVTNASGNLNAETEKIEGSDETDVYANKKYNSINQLKEYLNTITYNPAMWGHEAGQFATAIIKELKTLEANDPKAVNGFYDQIRTMIGGNLFSPEEMSEINPMDLPKGDATKYIKSNFRQYFNGLAGRAGLPGLQYGGPIGLGMPHIVGERGAELFTPGTSGTITPNNELATAKDSLAIANKLDQLNATMKLVASNTNNAASTEAMNEQISTLRSLLGEAKRTYRVSRDLRDSNYS